MPHQYPFPAAAYRCNYTVVVEKITEMLCPVGGSTVIGDPFHFVVFNKIYPGGNTFTNLNQLTGIFNEIVEMIEQDVFK